MPKHPTYRFTGISDFIASEGVKPSFAVKIPGLYFVGRASDALCQIPETDEQNRQAMFDVADEAIVALEAAVATVKAARAHVWDGVMPKPEPVVEKTDQKPPKPKGLLPDA